MISAEKIYKEIVEMPTAERAKLFATIARRGFEKDFYSHDEVFNEIRQSPFSLKEAAEYLESAVITVRRWVKAGKLKYAKIGRNFVFDPNELKAFKKTRKMGWRKQDFDYDTPISTVMRRLLTGYAVSYTAPITLN